MPRGWEFEARLKVPIREWQLSGHTYKWPGCCAKAVPCGATGRYVLFLAPFLLPATSRDSPVQLHRYISLRADSPRFHRTPFLHDMHLEMTSHPVIQSASRPASQLASHLASPEGHCERGSCSAVGSMPITRRICAAHSGAAIPASSEEKAHCERIVHVFSAQVGMLHAPCSMLYATCHARDRPQCKWHRLWEFSPDSAQIRADLERTAHHYEQCSNLVLHS